VCPPDCAKLLQISAPSEAAYFRKKDLSAGPTCHSLQKKLAELVSPEQNENSSAVQSETPANHDVTFWHGNMISTRPL